MHIALVKSFFIFDPSRPVSSSHPAILILVLVLFFLSLDKMNHERVPLKNNP